MNHYPPLILGKGVLVAPLVVFFVFFMIVSTILSSRRDVKHELEELAQFRVVIQQVFIYLGCKQD